MRTAGAGLIVDPELATVETVAAAVRSALLNRTFLERAHRASVILRSAGGAKEASNVIELAYRVGTTFELTFDSQLTWQQSLLQLDVYVVYCALLGSLALLARQCWSGLLSIWHERNGTGAGGGAGNSSAGSPLGSLALGALGSGGTGVGVAPINPSLTGVSSLASGSSSSSTVGGAIAWLANSLGFGSPTTAVHGAHNPHTHRA